MDEKPGMGPRGQAGVRWECEWEGWFWGFGQDGCGGGEGRDPCHAVCEEGGTEGNKGGNTVQPV
jgi:hypothetical protein